MIRSFVITLAAVFVASAVAQAQTSPESAPTDPQIAVTADNVDIEAGKLAAEKTSNLKVKEFAELMVRDHTTRAGLARCRRGVDY